MRLGVPGWNVPRRALEFGRELKGLEASDFYEFDFQDVQILKPTLGRFPAPSATPPRVITVPP
jgi:hypothetical protein